MIGHLDFEAIFGPESGPSESASTGPAVPSGLAFRSNRCEPTRSTAGYRRCILRSAPQQTPCINGMSPDRDLETVRNRGCRTAELSATSTAEPVKAGLPRRSTVEFRAADDDRSFCPGSIRRPGDCRAGLSADWSADWSGGWVHAAEDVSDEAASSASVSYSLRPMLPPARWTLSARSPGSRPLSIISSAAIMPLE